MAITTRTASKGVTGSNATQTIAVTKPGSLADGDVLLAHFVLVTSNTTAPGISSAASGWTRLTSWSSWDGSASGGSFGGVGEEYYYKVITSAAGEGASYSWTFTNVTGKIAYVCVPLVGADTTTPFGTGANTGATSTVTTARNTPSVTATTGQKAIVGFAESGTGITTTLAGGLTSIDVQSGSGNTTNALAISTSALSAGSISYSSTSSSNGSIYLVSIGLVNLLVVDDPPTLNHDLIGNDGGAIVIDASASVAGEGHALSLSFSPSTLVTELADADDLIAVIEADPDDVISYTVTLTEATTGLTDTVMFDVQPQSAGADEVIVNVAAPRSPATVGTTSWIS